MYLRATPWVCWTSEVFALNGGKKTHWRLDKVLTEQVVEGDKSPVTEKRWDERKQKKKRKDERLTQSQRWGSKGRMQNSLSRAIFNLSHHMRQGNIRGFVRCSCHRGCCCRITAIFFFFSFLSHAAVLHRNTCPTKQGPDPTKIIICNRQFLLTPWNASPAAAEARSVYVSVKYAFLKKSAWLHAASGKSCLR